MKEDNKNIAAENKSNQINQNSFNNGKKKLNTLKFKREDLKQMKINVSIIHSLFI